MQWNNSLLSLTGFSIDDTSDSSHHTGENCSLTKVLDLFLFPFLFTDNGFPLTSFSSPLCF